jgi:hypothetical protein
VTLQYRELPSGHVFRVRCDVPGCTATVPVVPVDMLQRVFPVPADWMRGSAASRQRHNCPLHSGQAAAAVVPVDVIDVPWQDYPADALVITPRLSGVRG